MVDGGCTWSMDSGVLVMEAYMGIVYYIGAVVILLMGIQMTLCMYG